MKQHFLSLVLSCLTVMLMAWGDTETRELSSFDGVSVSLGIEATLVKGSINKIDIEADGVELDKISTEVNGGELKVNIDQKWWQGGWGKNRKVHVVITFTEELDHISSSAGSRITNEGVIASDDLEVEASSGSNTYLTIEAGAVNADVSSGASITLKGMTESLDVDASSGSSFKGYDLKSTNVTADGSSGSTIHVHVSGTLNADVSSGASVKYKGSPSSKTIDKSSGGSVREA